MTELGRLSVRAVEHAQSVGVLLERVADVALVQLIREAAFSTEKSCPWEGSKGLVNSPLSFLIHAPPKGFFGPKYPL